MINPRTDILISCMNTAQKKAFAEWMRGEGAEAFYKSKENKALGTEKMESVEVQTEEDGSDYVHIEIE